MSRQLALILLIHGQLHFHIADRLRELAHTCMTLARFKWLEDHIILFRFSSGSVLIFVLFDNLVPVLCFIFFI